jgi:hypothetical protein
MTSLKQIDANRRNALKSTGPTTVEGKMRSRGNAIRHGLTAETVITSIENGEDYRAFEATVIADYDAETAVQRELVLRLASIFWRLRRATNIETAVFESVLTESDQSLAGVPKPMPREHGGSSQPYQLCPPTTCNGIDRKVGDCFLRLAALPTFPLDRLSRYEHILWRQARQIIFALNSTYRCAQRRQRFPMPFGV